MSGISVSPATATVGDPITVAIAIDAPARSVVRLTNPASTPEFTRLAVSPWRFRRENAGWRIERTETWAPFRTGAAPPARWTWTMRTAGGSERRGVLSAPPIAVRTVLPSGTETAAAAPLRPPITRPFVPWQVPAAIGLVLLVGLLFGTLLRRRKSATTTPRTADEIFEGELDLLEASLSNGAPEETFYDWLAEIMRWYLEQKRGFPAPKQTASEIAGRLRTAGPDGAAGPVASVFAVCDGYRFARREHRRDLALSAIAAARNAAHAIQADDAAREGALRSGPAAPAAPKRESA